MLIFINVSRVRNIVQYKYKYAKIKITTLQLNLGITSVCYWRQRKTLERKELRDKICNKMASFAQQSLKKYSGIVSEFCFSHLVNLRELIDFLFPLGSFRTKTLFQHRFSSLIVAPTLILVYGFLGPCHSCEIILTKKSWSLVLKVIFLGYIGHCLSFLKYILLTYNNF